MSSGTGGGGGGGGETRAVDELASLVRPVGRGLRRRLPEIVIGLAVLITVLAVFALAGALVDDRAIAANPATAEAEVLDGSAWNRTLVRFTIANGEVRVPELGVYYPSGLQPGTKVAVEYDVTDPDAVRVAGRSALDSAAPLALEVLATWALLAPIALHLRRRSRPRP